MPCDLCRLFWRLPPPKPEPKKHWFWLHNFTRPACIFNGHCWLSFKSRAEGWKVKCWFFESKIDISASVKGVKSTLKQKVVKSNCFPWKLKMWKHVTKLGPFLARSLPPLLILLVSWSKPSITPLNTWHAFCLRLSQPDRPPTWGQSGIVIQLIFIYFEKVANMDKQL